MGDILHALPAVTALRREHPGWIIDWVVEPRWRALLAAHSSPGRIPGASVNPEQPLVDGIHTAPVKEWGRGPLAPKTLQQIRALRRALRSAEYDAVLDLQGAVRSAWIGSFAASRLIGESAPREYAARFLFSERVPTSGAHVIEQDLELAAAVAADSLSHAAPWLPADPAAESWAEALLSGSPAKPAVLINPGAGWGAKRWPVERYAEVAQGLIRRGLLVLVNTGPGEESLSQAIVKATGGAAVSLSCTLDQLIAITRRIALAIAGDTGPLHLACALDRPVVGIYGPTDPARNGPFGVPFRVLRNPESRRDHSRRTEPEAGLLTIAPEAVLSAADELLAPQSTQKAAS